MEFNFEHNYFIQFIDWVVTTALKSGIRILIILILTIIALKLARMLSSRVVLYFNSDGDIEVRKRVDTISSVIRYILIVVILMVATMMIMREINFDIAPILAAAGVVGVAVGFGAQNLIQDVIGGFFLLLEDQIRVGDVVDIAGKGGLVERITLRMTVLRDLSGNVHYIRNSQINIVTNMTKIYSYYVFDIGVSYNSDIDHVIKVIREIDEDLRNDPAFSENILEPIEILGLDKFADSAIIIKARTKTKPITQWSVGREFNRRLKIRFDSEKIEIPFPQRTVSMDENTRSLLSQFRQEYKDGANSLN